MITGFLLLLLFLIVAVVVVTTGVALLALRLVFGVLRLTFGLLALPFLALGGYRREPRWRYRRW